MLGGLDWLSIAVGITALGAIALAFWIAPDIRDAFDDPFGDVSETPEEMRAAPKGGGMGRARATRTTHTSDNHRGSVIKP